MGIYIVILCAIILLGLLIKPNSTQNKKKLYIFIVFGMLTIISAIRSYQVGIDTEQFVNAFKYINRISFENAFDVRYEVGFVIFCRIIGLLSQNSQIFIIFTSIIIIPIIGYFIYRNSKNVLMSSFLFVTLNQYAMYMNASRQAIAIAIILIGYEFLKKDKNIKFIICVVLATLFHQTALVMLVLIPIKKMKYSNKSYIITLVLGVISFLIADKIFDLGVSIFKTYEGYEQSGFYESSLLAGSVNAVIIFLVLTLGRFFKGDQDKEYQFLAYMISLLFIIDMTVIKINIFVRLATYFSIFNIIWIPKICSSIKDKNQRMFVEYMIYVCFILYWIIVSIYRPEWYGVIPYSPFWRVV